MSKRQYGVARYNLYNELLAKFPQIDPDEISAWCVFARSFDKIIIQGPAGTKIYIVNGKINRVERPGNASARSPRKA